MKKNKDLVEVLGKVDDTLHVSLTEQNLTEIPNRKDNANENIPVAFSRLAKCDLVVVKA